MLSCWRMVATRVELAEQMSRLRNASEETESHIKRVEATLFAARRGLSVVDWLGFQGFK